jgi:hypothetical protein
VVSGQSSLSGTLITVVDRNPGQSLFCYSLMLPWGYESTLLAFQYSKGASIFGCDEYGVYSNRRMVITPGLNTSVVQHSLKCEFGGEFGTALNTEIFLAVWAKVIADGRYAFHDWTAKVDPDAVFFPLRLRSLVQSHQANSYGGVYLNNCRLGMHGPLEVFSTAAVRLMGGGLQQCKQYFDQVCDGPCQWGEDMFVDQCFQKVLHVVRDNEYNLLMEDHCDPPAGWQSCQGPGSVSVAAFHPFKSVATYQQCMDNALVGI